MALPKHDSPPLDDKLSKLTISGSETDSEKPQPSTAGKEASISEYGTIDTRSAVDITSPDPQEAKRLKAKEKKKRHEKKRKAKRKEEQRAAKMALTKDTESREEGDEAATVTESGRELTTSDATNTDRTVRIRLTGIVVGQAGSRGTLDNAGAVVVDSDKADTSEGSHSGMRVTGHIFEIEVNGERRTISVMI